MPSLHVILTTAVALVCCTSAVSALPNIYTKRTTTSSLRVPLNGLPAPEGLTLRYVALGQGTQNYTCANTTSAPVAIGAVATLYDATSLITASPIVIPNLTALAYSVGSSLGLPTLGHHWFSASGVPTFSLEAADPRAFLSAKKVNSVAAPKFSVPNSVAWLYLRDDGRGISRGLKAVYRVETAGGGPPAACVEVGELAIKYAAEYWFFD